jgi:putative transcriptional regulator
MKAGKAGHVHRIPVSTVTEARTRTGLSQPQFAELLGVSPRTLQEWEQGRRNPSGAARTLLTIAHRRPEAILEAIGAGNEPEVSPKDSRSARSSAAGSRTTVRASGRKG